MCSWTLKVTLEGRAPAAKHPGKCRKRQVKVRSAKVGFFLTSPLFAWIAERPCFAFFFLYFQLHEVHPDDQMSEDRERERCGEERQQAAEEHCDL